MNEENAKELIESIRNKAEVKEDNIEELKELVKETTKEELKKYIK